MYAFFVVSLTHVVLKKARGNLEVGLFKLKMTKLLSMASGYSKCVSPFLLSAHNGRQITVPSLG